MSPQISLILLSHNRENYLGAAIESVLAQTFTNFELLIWDDGSEDGSLAIAQRYAQQDSRVRVVAAPHQGIPRSRHQAIAQTTGQYLGWVDSDDWLAPTALEHTMAVLKAHPHIGMVYTDHLEVDASGNSSRLGYRCQIPYSSDRLLVDFITFHFRLIRRSVFEQAGGINTEFKYAYDYDLCLRLSEVTEIYHLAEPLYYYRYHAGSMGRKIPQNRIWWSHKAVTDALKRRGLSDRLEVMLQPQTMGQQQVQRFVLRRKCSPVPTLPTASNLAPWLKAGAIAASLPLAALLLSMPASAQVRPSNDGTGTRVTRDGNRYDIQGGQRSRDGANLFHSFEQLDLSQQEIANFLATPDLQNILGRIGGGSPSYIDGILRITGGNPNLLLMNPAGILFGANAQLDLPAAFTATTATGIGFDGGWFSATGAVDYAALVGNPTSFAFTLAQPGALVNAGDLAVQPGSALGLLGGLVLNTGTLSAPGGTITLAAVPGENLVRLSQPGSLLSLDFEPIQPGDALPNPTSITPAILPTLLTGGNLDSATGLTVNPDGSVSLTSSGVTIPQESGIVAISGNLDVSSPDGTGGQITGLGDRLALLSANLDASGTTGGGTVRLGGDYRGGDTLPTAQQTFVSEDSTINADALVNGDGGRIILWSDGSTSFYGDIVARGGATGGEGGFVEISSLDEVIFRGSIDLSAPNGLHGTFLLDPTNIIISETGNETPGLPSPVVDPFAIRQNDFPGQTITILASTLQSIGSANIILEATNDIIIQDLTSGFLNIGFGYGYSLTLIADADNSGAGSVIMNPSNFIFMNGGDFTASGFNVTLGSVNTGGGFGSTSGDINVRATNDIFADLIDTGGFNAGDVRLIAGGDVTVTTIDASGNGEGSEGGDVVVRADLFRATGTLFEDPDGPSISAFGDDFFGGASGTVSITHAGGPNNVPFIVGNASINGTAGSIEAGGDRLENRSFPVLINGGAATIPPSSTGISIASVNAPPTLNPRNTLFSGAINEPITITYADLIASFSDPNNDNVVIRVSNILAGSLTRNGIVLSAGTVINPGDTLVYTPPRGTTGTLDAFAIAASDLSNGTPVLATSAPVPIQVSVNLIEEPPPLPRPGIVLPEGFSDPRVDLPPPPALQPPEVISTTPVEISVPISEQEFTSDFTSYLGLEEPPLRTIDDARTIAQQIESATGARPAFVYISFVPATVDLLTTNPAPQDSDQLELVIVTARGGLVRRRIPEATRSQVMAMAQEFRSEVSNPRRTRTTSYLPSAQQLYTWLIAPLKADLQQYGITNLVFLPTAGLRSLPFSALHDGNEFLIQQYSIGLMPSLSLTDTRYVDIRDSQMLAMGVSEAVQGQVPLPSVPIELSTLVLDLWRGRLFLNNEATVENLREVRQEQPFGIIHLATHADFVSGPVDNSYIQFWNERLTLEEVRNLGLNDPPVEMLALSACRTALGNEEAELGFAGLAVQAGVKTAIASFWYVSDAGTTALMTEFYDALREVPVKAEALRQAQIRMASGEISLEDQQVRGLSRGGTIPLPSTSLPANNESLSHPYYWAAFTLIGNPW